MSKRHTPVFLTQKEYDELLQKVETPLDPLVASSEIKPVGRVRYDKRKHKDRDNSKSRELL